MMSQFCLHGIGLRQRRGLAVQSVKDSLPQGSGKQM
jgi:hypothetical protein